MGWLGEFQLWGGLYSENYVGSFFQLSVFYFCFFSSLHRSSLRILEYLREVWSWFWIVFHSLLIWRHGVRIISPKQWSKKNPKPSAQGLPYKHLSLIYLFAVHCTALLLPAKASPFPGLNSGRWGHPPTVDGWVPAITNLSPVRALNLCSWFSPSGEAHFGSTTSGLLIRGGKREQKT